MSDVLDLAVKTATEQAWAIPQDDFHITLEPALFTPRAGTKGSLDMMWDSYPLPDLTNTYVILQIGQLDLESLGLTGNIDNWTAVNTFATDNDAYIRVHTADRNMLMHSAFIRKNIDRSIFIAINVKHNRDFLAFNERIFIRLYSNSWLRTADGKLGTGVTTEGHYVENVNDAIIFRNKYDAAQTGDGHTFLFHGGFYRHTLANQDIELGHRMEYIQDTSIKGFFDVNLTDLEHFESSRDKLRKYLIQQPDSNDNDLSPTNEVEIFVCTTLIGEGSGQEFILGVPYSDLYSSNIRLVTHRDWTVETQRIQDIVNSQSQYVPFDKVFLRVFTRESRAKTAIIEDGNLIKDLYLLDKDTRANLMIGNSAVVPEWAAENLEDAAFLKWTEATSTNLTIDNLKNVYSYHGIHDLMERPTVEGTVATLPPMMAHGGLILRYNSTGQLVGHTDVVNGNNYSFPAGTTSIEVVPGKRAFDGRDMEAFSSQEKDDVDVYAQELIYADASGVWRSAVEGTDFNYNDDRTQVNWTIARFADDKAKRLSGSYYYRTFTAKVADISKPMDIFEDIQPYSGLDLGRLTVWLNNRKLVRGIDYVVSYPTFRIISREFYTADDVSLFLVYNGLGADKLPPKLGWVKHRMINYNHSFDLSFNRNNILTINGYKADKADVVFSENRVGTMDGRFAEGRPYSIEYPVNHIGNGDLGKLTVTKAEAVAKDKSIEAYLSTILTEPAIDTPVTITSLYQLVSPLMHQLIEDVLSGDLVPDYDTASDAYVASLVNPYLYLLTYDPVTNSDIDWDFCDLHPTGRLTVSTVTTEAYTFLNRVNALYLESRCNLNSYLVVA